MKNERTNTRELVALIGACVLAITAGAGCTERMDNITFRALSEPPRPVTLSSERIQIEHGIAVGVNAIPTAGGEEIASTVLMTSTDETIFGVESVSDNVFILFGTFPGECQLRVNETSTGAQVDLPVTVVEQP